MRGILHRDIKHLGNSYVYIEKYSNSAKLTSWQACLKVISETEKVLNLILDWKSLKELEEVKGTKA